MWRLEYSFQYQFYFAFLIIGSIFTTYSYFAYYLGISIGTAVSGLFIASVGIQSTPWVMFAFCSAALLMMLVRNNLYKRSIK